MVSVKVPRGVLGVVVRVSFEVAPLVPGTTLDGDNVQVADIGAPVQVSPTVALTAPPTGNTVTVDVPDRPRLTLTLDGLTPTEKSMPTPFKLALGLVVVIPSDPDTLSNPLRAPVAVGVKVTL